MWYKLNQGFGIILLIAVVCGAAYYVFSGPPLLRQKGQEVDPRHNRYAREVLEEHEKVMRDLQRNQSALFDEAMDVSRRAFSQ